MIQLKPDLSMVRDKNGHSLIIDLTSSTLAKNRRFSA
jgi:hypothetical protein